MPERPYPKVEEVQISNDIPAQQPNKGQTVEQPSQDAQNDQTKAVVQQDPRPHITSTPLFKYIIIGLAVVLLVGVIIYVVKTYVLKPAEPVPDVRDEQIKTLTDELAKMKEQNTKMLGTVSQLRRENSLQMQTIKELNENARFDKDGKQHENSYDIPDEHEESPPTDREKLQSFIDKRHKKPVVAEDEGVASEHVSDRDDDEHEDDNEYEYDDVVDEDGVDEDPEQDESEPELPKVEEVKPKKGGKKRVMNDDDILALVAASAD
jgi:hypothetical protein